MGGRGPLCTLAHPASTGALRRGPHGRNKGLEAPHLDSEGPNLAQDVAEPIGALRLLRDVAEEPQGVPLPPDPVIGEI